MKVAPAVRQRNTEANNSLCVVRDKCMEQPDGRSSKAGLGQASARRGHTEQPAKATELAHQSMEKSESIGVKVVASRTSQEL